MATASTGKSLILLNLVAGDGEGNVVDNSELLLQMEALADGGKTIAVGTTALSNGATLVNGNQYQWQVDDAKLTAAKDLIDTFIGNHVLAETPAYQVLSIS
jgi:hypothetical protein